MRRSRTGSTCSRCGGAGLGWHRPSAQRHTRPDRPGAYADIKVPSLVIGFTDDMTLPPYLGKEVADAIPGGQYVEISDAGHLGFIERPDEVNRVILEFFASTAQTV